MACKCAPSCRKALDDATARWPNRDRASDGCCGDASHQKRKSDHNVGNAFDLTHDLQNGVNCHVLSISAMRDPRITYVIWNGLIFKRRTGQWEEYEGVNPHKHHMHVSIKPESRNDLSPWPWSIGTADVPPASSAKPILRLKSSGQEVRVLQSKLGIAVDGQFGYGTEKAVKRFQESKGLTADGIVGPATWKALG